MFGANSGFDISNVTIKQLELDLINIFSCFSAQSVSPAGAVVQLHDGDKHLGGEHQLHHHQQVQQVHQQVTGVESQPADRQEQHFQQPYSPLNLARVKIEKSPAGQDYQHQQQVQQPASPASQDYQHQQQGYNWLGYSQGLYGNDLKSESLAQLPSD